MRDNSRAALFALLATSLKLQSVAAFLRTAVAARLVGLEHHAAGEASDLRVSAAHSRFLCITNTKPMQSPSTTNRCLLVYLVRLVLDQQGLAFLVAVGLSVAALDCLVVVRCMALVSTYVNFAPSVVNTLHVKPCIHRLCKHAQSTGVFIVH